MSVLRIEESTTSFTLFRVSSMNTRREPDASTTTTLPARVRNMVATSVFSKPSRVEDSRTTLKVPFSYLRTWTLPPVQLFQR